MGRPTNESKEIAELIAKGMTQEDAEKLTAEERAVLLAPSVDDAAAQLAAQAAELEALRADLAARDSILAERDAKLAENEAALVAATAEATNAKSENDALRDHLSTLASQFDEDGAPIRVSRPGEIRVKGPMLIHFVPPADYDPAEDGPLPASYPLTKGLNVDVPAWVLNTFIVQANREED